MKRTRIIYLPIGKDFIKIIRIENAATSIELRDEFGVDVSSTYLDTYPSYFQSNNLDKRVLIWDSSGTGSTIYPNSSWDKTKFSQLIATMKLAGENLVMIKKQFADKAEKVIEI